MDEDGPKDKLEFTTGWICPEPKGLVIDEPGVRLNEVELRDTSALALTSDLVSNVRWVKLLSPCRESPRG